MDWLPKNEGGQISEVATIMPASTSLRQALNTTASRPEASTPAEMKKAPPQKAHKKSPNRYGWGFGSVNKSGDTYFRAFGTIIGSKSLTAVFGMGTGMTFSIWSPEKACTNVWADASLMTHGKRRTDVSVRSVVATSRLPEALKLLQSSSREGRA